MVRHQIAVLVRDGVLAMELGIVHRVFGEARDERGDALYEVVTCALEAGPVRTDGDFTIDVEHGVQALAGAATVVVAATDHDVAGAAELRDSPVVAAIRRIGPGVRLASICTATFLLAASGVLDGRSATTHWARVDELQARFPDVHVRPDVLYTDHGDVLTSAGVASIADMCVHMIRSDHGAAVGSTVARRVVMAPHRQADESQLLKRPLVESRVSGTKRARRWALEHLERPVNLQDLARQEGVSTRTLTRRFREEVGTSPTRWLLARRLDRARELLETTDAGVELVAERCGFGSAAAMRMHMRSALDVAPSAYRDRFATRSGESVRDPGSE
jgi:transcriptional regulator GlxA family with amidase domain